jgi:hypothetical protein
MKRQKIATNFAAKEYVSLKLINKRRKPLQYFRKKHRIHLQKCESGLQRILLWFGEPHLLKW